MMKLTYVWHDCFLLETAEFSVVFDYWQEPELGRLLSLIDVEKPLYVVVSHHHKDHFNKEIFLWAKRFDHIHYVVSKDVFQSVRYILKEGSTYRGEYRVSPEQVSVLRPGDVYVANGLQIHAFGSTDTGNSYLLEFNGRFVFHSGDLNAWVWKDESTDKEVAAALCDFKSKIEPISDVSVRIDLAMFPVDSRIGREYWEGAKIFVHRFDVSHFVPMHFELGATRDEVERFRRDAVCFDAYRNVMRGDYHSMQVPYGSLLVE